MKKVELGIDIDGKTAGCIAMPDFTQDWIYGDDASAYTHKTIDGLNFHVWVRGSKQACGIEKDDELEGITISEEAEQDRLIKDGWTPPKAKKKEKKE